MSYVFEALKQAEAERGGKALELAELVNVPAEVLQTVQSDKTWLDQVQVIKAVPSSDSRLVTFTDGDALGAEKFRLLRARLRHLQEKNQLHKIIVTSGVPNDGKTLVSSNLAASLASHNAQRVLLLEGDLRQPVMSGRFGLSRLQGITEWAQQDLPIDQFMYRFEGTQLFLLPAGQPTQDASKVITSDRFVEVLNKISASFDWVIIDTPPLFPVADVHLWSKHADGVLLVIRQGSTPKKLLRRGLKSLDGANLLGIVLNDVPTVEHSYYQKYYDGTSTGKS
jgi:capsular exopolysaccharide synthesis family protein